MGKVATRGRRGLPLPTSRIPEMQIRLNYRRIVNPFRGGAGGVRETGRDGTRQDDRGGREGGRFYAESAAGRYSASLRPPHTLAPRPSVCSTARVGTTRMDASCGCTCASPRLAGTALQMHDV